MVSIPGNKVAQKNEVNITDVYRCVSLQMCSFRIWPLETAIMQARQAAIKPQNVIF